ncbi:TPA: DNA-binding protein [Klebsiella pneumoniae]
MDFAFSKQDVKNIAITGPYGAGKSTVIQSYLKTHLNREFINVSLADFSLSGKSDEAPLENSEIELSILQQILYKENKDNLPDSRIDRIQNRNKKHISSLFLTVLSVVAPLLLLAITIFPKYFFSLFGATEPTINVIVNMFPERFFVSIIMGLLCLFFIVRVASKAGIFDKKIKLSKIAFLQGSADMASQESSSLLNNCLDEIVYFFSRSQYKIVVFEDLDRLGNAEVFVKLREINQIVNNNLQSEPVRFIYACRDDIFLGADIRTKFFDFILPVIPVMDARNAYTHLKNKLYDFPENEQPLLKQMSLYISDMRSLQNIVNEFNLFKKVVDDNTNQAKIFALIFYKNIYAQDYNLTDKKSGVLYSFIHNYRLRKLHENHFKLLDQRLEELNNKLVKIRKESVSTDAELRKQIISRFISPELWPIVYFIKDTGNYHQRYIKFSAESFYNSEHEFINYFEQNSSLYIGYPFNGNQHQLAKIDSTSIIEEYKQRNILISSNRDDAYKKTTKEIEELKENIRTRNAISLANLLKIIGWENFRTIAEEYIATCDDRTIIDPEQLETIRNGFRFGGFEALYYLLTNGYIMQDFMMFRSIFNQGTISANDNDYIKAVGRYIGCEEANQTFLLDNSKDVLAELVGQHYQYREGALHHQIIAFLLDSQDNQDHKTLSAMIAMIFRQPASVIIAIFKILEDRFINVDYFTRLVVSSLSENKYLDKMISVLKEQEHNAISKSIASKMIALVSPDISTDQKNYQKFIEDLGFSLVSEVEPNNLQYFLHNIEQLQVIYHDIYLPVTPNEMKALNFIGDHQMYPLDRATYRVVVAGLLQSDNVTCEMVDDLPWSLLDKHQLSKIKVYVNDNINIFVKDIFIDSKESSNAIVSVITHSDLSDELKILILEKMQFTVTGLNEFPEYIDVDGNELSYHDLFYRYDHVTPGWEALLAYICEECNLEILTQYIENYADVLSQEAINLMEGDRYDLLYMKVICNDNLSDSAYAAILEPVYINTHHWDERMSLKNLYRLIKNRKIELDPETFKQAIQYFISNNDLKRIEPFVLWFSQFKDNFFPNIEYYLCVNQDDVFFKESLIGINNSHVFTLQEKSSILFKCREHYELSLFEELTISNEGLIALVNTSTDDNFTIYVIIKLLKNGYRSRTEIAHFVSRLEEKEYTKIFYQKSATLNLDKPQEAELFLSALQQANLIKKWTLRDVGKYYVQCRYEEDESYLD